MNEVRMKMKTKSKSIISMHFISIPLKFTSQIFRIIEKGTNTTFRNQVTLC